MQAVRRHGKTKLPTETCIAREEDPFYTLADLNQLTALAINR